MPSQAVQSVEVNTNAGRYYISRDGDKLKCEVLGAHASGNSEIAYWHQIPASARPLVAEAVKSLDPSYFIPEIDPTKKGSFSYGLPGHR